MNPSHGLSWEKSGEQEGVFATLFILTGKLQLGIKTKTIDIPNNTSYIENVFTAEKDCHIICKISGNGYSGELAINNIEYILVNTGEYTKTTTLIYPPIYLQKGDIITSCRSVGLPGSIDIYE